MLICVHVGSTWKGLGPAKTAETKLRRDSEIGNVVMCAVVNIGSCWLLITWCRLLDMRHM